MEDEGQETRRPYQNYRSQASSNWRTKDETPREPQPRSSNRSTNPEKGSNRSYDSPRKEAGASSSFPDAAPGTRLYVGNLLYSAKAKDVEQLFTDNGFSQVQINMSTDPFTGRNPSYCFADLSTAEEAAAAMAALNGQDVLGRAVRINPGVTKKSFGSSPRVKNYDGGWKGRDESSALEDGGSYKPTFDRWSRTDASARFEQNPRPSEAEGRRLYVGGLPRIEPASSVDQEMQALFSGFSIEAVSKLISPHPSKASIPGNHYYLFVDLASSEEADNAISMLDAKESKWGGALKVNKARGAGERKERREKWEQGEEGR